MRFSFYTSVFTLLKACIEILLAVSSCLLILFYFCFHFFLFHFRCLAEMLHRIHHRHCVTYTLRQNRIQWQMEQENRRKRKIPFRVPLSYNKSENSRKSRNIIYLLPPSLFFRFLPIPQRSVPFFMVAILNAFYLKPQGKFTVMFLLFPVSNKKYILKLWYF